MNRLVILIPFVLSNLITYMTLDKTSFAKNLPLQPPSYVFGVVWSVLYLLFGEYFYRIHKHKEPHLNWLLYLWWTNLICNVMWSPTVFKYKKYTYGVYIIVLMMATLIGMIGSTKNIISRNMLIPYLSWLIIALLLNVELVKR